MTAEVDDVRLGFVEGLKLVGFAILGSGYVAIVATLVHAVGG